MPKFFLLTAVLFLSAFNFHPLHVSICEIEYDEANKSVEVIQRIFIDDLEEELRETLKLPELDITQPNNGKTTDDLLKTYLKQNLFITVNSKKSDYKYLGHEVEGDAFFCYLEIEKIKKLKSIRVESNILLDHYEDQINIVHVKLNGKNKSMKLSGHQRFDEFSYE